MGLLGLTGLPPLDDVLDFLVQERNLDTVVGLVHIVRVQTHQVETRDLLTVFFLENHPVNIELDTVVPEVTVGDMRDTGDDGGLVTKCLVFDTLTAFPVVDLEGTVGVFEDHIDGPRDFEFFVIHHPLGTVGLELGEILDKLLEILEFDTVVFDLGLVVVAFDIVVHVGTGLGGLVTVLFPGGFDVFLGHVIVSVGGVLGLGGGEDTGDDTVTVELGEQAMDDRGDGGEALLTMDGIDMGSFVEGDVLVPGVGVLGDEVIGDGLVHGHVVGGLGWMGD